MKKLLLFAWLLSVMISNAQTNSDPVSTCKSAFKYSINDSIISIAAGNVFLPSTTVSFFDKSIGQVKEWHWDFGDGGQSTKQNPNYVFYFPVMTENVKINPYRVVTLTILTVDNCKSFYSETINIMDPNSPPESACSALFSYYQLDYDTLKKTATVEFANFIQGDSVKYLWKFNNGQTSNERKIVQTFDLSKQEHNVCLTVTGANKCVDTHCETINLYNPNDPDVINSCSAYFKYALNDSIRTLLPATAINFYDKSEGKAIKWSWDFGDGYVSQEQNPMHIFNHNSGVVSDGVVSSPYRTVSLTISTDNGCESFYSEDINILDGTPYIKPNCSAWYSYYTAVYDEEKSLATIQFENYAEGDSIQYFWKFDDGQTSTKKDPMIQFDLTKKEREVCLTIKGANNCSDSYCEIVFLDPSTFIEPKACEPYFWSEINYKINTLLPALVLDFYSKSACEVKEWKWDFGDGKSSNAANPTHIFELPSIGDDIQAVFNPFRKVCLTTITEKDTITHCETINLYMDTTPKDSTDLCHPWFKYSKVEDMITIPEVVPYRFVDISKAKVVKRFWQFDNGETSVEESPIAYFNIFEPFHKVCLTIYTADNCISTWCEEVQTSEFPDSTYIIPWSKYSMHYTSGFPAEMSSCAGYATAKVYLNDEPVKAENYTWSTGDFGQSVKGLCPTQSYTVKAMTPDGEIVSGSFIMNSDGTVTEIPMIWWMDGNPGTGLLISSEMNQEGYSVEWRLCDGTIVKSDTISLNLINCGGSESNMMLKDASGKIVYSENISLKTLATYIDSDLINPSSISIFPNPVKDVLNISYTGSNLNKALIEIIDVSGKRVYVQDSFSIGSGDRIGINVITLQKGLYVCKITSENRVIGIEKFVK